VNGLELLIRYTAVLLFFAVAFKAILKLQQHRSAENLYFALYFGTLAASAAVIEIARLDGIALGLENRLFGLAIAAHPYLLMLLISTIRTVPQLFLIAGATGLIATVLLVTFAVPPAATPQPTVQLIIPLIYFFGVQGWGAASFWKEAQNARGILRNRHLFVVAGMLLLAGMMSLHLWYIYWPGSALADTLYTLLTAATAVAYYVGFEPPAFVRRFWQIIQINTYQSGIIGTLINKPVDRILRYMAQASIRAVGGQNSIIVTYQSVDQRLSLTTEQEALTLRIAPEDLASLGQFARDLNPNARYIRRRDLDAQRLAANILDGFQANAMFVVPVVEFARSLTLVIIIMRSGTLFVDEDLNILNSFAQQARAILENNSLIAETQGLVEELRDETDDLEEMVMQREQALRASEDELYRRLVQMSALYRELEAFSYSVSHDLRTPLRAITGFSEALIEDYGATLPPEAREYLQRITANSHKMSDLMDSMLKLSKLSRTEMTLTDVDLTDTAVRVTHELRALHPAHEVAFQVDPGLVAHADTELVRVLLTNLLSNAWKYTRGVSQPVVALRHIKIDGENTFVVSDNGVGFEMAYSDKLFKPFKRLHPEDDFTGSGIGLAIVQRIVNRHGGRVWAESQPSAGAKFYFTLPGELNSPL
jgi:signal transduction histidine kinase